MLVSRPYFGRAQTGAHPASPERIADVSPKQFRSSFVLDRLPRAAVLAPLLLTLACGGSRPGADPSRASGSDPAASDPAGSETTGSFLAIDRQTGSGGDADRVRQMVAVAPGSFDPDHSFYLAINKRELDQRWFASAYLKQFSDQIPRWDSAASSRGTRVVSFRIQNGKLFMFDVDDRRQQSDTFGSDDIVDAYPIVDVATLIASGVKLDDRLRHKLDDYVVIDPAAGLNRYGVVGDAYGSGDIGFDSFKVELAFSQNFRALDDGVAFEQAFTGYSSGPHSKLDGVDGNYFRSSGVLGLALRRYKESEGFVSAQMPATDFFFPSSPRRVPNTGQTDLPVAKWNIHPGMTPIKWLISPQALKRSQDPDLASLGVDLVAALKAGVESWNEAFGFTALQAELASPDDSFADDSKNYLIYDVNPAVEFAFADWRINPNTGEIRGASVYFNDVFTEGALYEYGPVPAAGAAKPPSIARAMGPHRTLTWLPFPHQPLCDLTPSPLTATNREVGLPSAATGTPKEKIEKLIAGVVAHEIGHTLSLRHNFKGSLVPPTSSVMDYVNDDIRIAAPAPGSYDVEAIRHLYGLSPTPPTQPFCTDEQTEIDPACARFDEGADPLRDFWGPLFTIYNRYYLSTGNKLVANYAVARVLPGLVLYMQSAEKPADRTAAWDFATVDIRTPVAPAHLTQFPYTYAAGVNFMTSALLGLMVPDPATLLPPFEGLPPLEAPVFDAAVTGLLLGELRGNVLNVDGIRTFPTRRLAVDSLKWMQSVGAFDVLRETRATLAAPVEPPLTGDEAALTDDLLARIQKAITPYFN
jgi:hypothetical protein